MLPVRGSKRAKWAKAGLPQTPRKGVWSRPSPHMPLGHRSLFVPGSGCGCLSTSAPEEGTPVAISTRCAGAAGLVRAWRAAGPRAPSPAQAQVAGFARPPLVARLVVDALPQASFASERIIGDACTDSRSGRARCPGQGVLPRCRSRWRPCRSRAASSSVRLLLVPHTAVPCPIRRCPLR